MIGCGGSNGGSIFVEMHPDAEPVGCCWGEVMNGLEGCTCWEPVYDVEQVSPTRAATNDDVQVQPDRCEDCAYRPGSKELADPFLREELTLTTPARGERFWCHQGMRRPAAWRHPVHGDVPGSPDDWRPLQPRTIPYRADGTPALVCAGWDAIARKQR